MSDDIRMDPAQSTRVVYGKRHDVRLFRMSQTRLAPRTHELRIPSPSAIHSQSPSGGPSLSVRIRSHQGLAAPATGCPVPETNTAPLVTRMQDNSVRRTASAKPECER